MPTERQADTGRSANRLVRTACIRHAIHSFTKEYAFRATGRARHLIAVMSRREVFPFGPHSENGSEQVAVVSIAKDGALRLSFPSTIELRLRC